MSSNPKTRAGFNESLRTRSPTRQNAILTTICPVPPAKHVLACSITRKRLVLAEIRGSSEELKVPRSLRRAQWWCYHQFESVKGIEPGDVQLQIVDVSEDDIHCPKLHEILPRRSSLRWRHSSFIHDRTLSSFRIVSSIAHRNDRNHYQVIRSMVRGGFDHN